MAQEAVKFIDEYCEVYRDLFPEVRSYEYFKYLHLGLISEKKRKTFPTIAEVSGLENSQGIDYFLGKSGWSVEELRKRRLKLILSEVEVRDRLLIKAFRVLI